MQTRLFAIIFVLFFLKLLLAATFPLVADETYYYVWSQFPRLSYFDHPAMVSWLISAGKFIFPFHNPIQVRFLFVVLSTLTLCVWLLILKMKQIPKPQQIFFILFFTLNPLLGAGSILATPDVPLVFFWSLSYFCFLKIFDTSEIKWYGFLGVFLGLGFCSKYHIVLFVMAGVISIFFNKNFQKLRLSGVLLTVVSGLTFCLPVLIWNYQNNWSSFIFQLNHGFGRSYYKAEWSAGYLLAQFFLLGPFVATSLFVSFRKRTDQIFSLTQIGFFFMSTFKAVVEANWPITAHPHALADFVSVAKTKFLRWTVFYWIAIYIAFAAIWFSPSGRELITNQYTTNDVAEVAAVVKPYQPLYGPTYQISSLLSWQNKRLIPKLAEFSRKDFFDELSISRPKEKVFYVLKDMQSGWPLYLGTPTFKKLEVFDKLQLELYQVSYE